MDQIGIPTGTPAAGGDQVLHRVRHLLQQILNLETPEAIRPEARLREDLNIDSLGMVDVVLGIEEEFGVKLGSDINLLERVVTVGDAVALIIEQSAARHS